MSWAALHDATCPKARGAARRNHSLGFRSPSSCVCSGPPPLLRCGRKPVPPQLPGQCTGTETPFLPMPKSPKVVVHFIDLALSRAPCVR